jgi:hypothetical protein
MFQDFNISTAKGYIRVQFKTVGDGLQSVFANTGIIKDGINIAETFHQQL